MKAVCGECGAEFVEGECDASPETAIQDHIEREHSGGDGPQDVDCPCCRDASFTHRDFLMEHLHQYHTAAEVYVAVVEE